MHAPLLKSPLALLTTILLTFTTFTSGERLLKSTSLNPCPGSKNSGFSATLFNVLFTPDNNTIAYNINAISSISEKVTAQIQVIAYGFVFYNQTINPCKQTGLEALCPLKPGNIPLKSNNNLDPKTVSQVPGIAYAVPDLDGKVRVFIKNEAGGQIACVEAELSNGQTVDQLGVKWATAIIAGLGLLASAVTSGLGHSNTAAHVAANALSLFGLFQAQAMIGMTAIDMPPIVQSWTQDFQWSMGIIKIGFIQTICTWYQRATGGTPSTIIANLGNVSVEIQKRSLDVVKRLVSRGYDSFVNTRGSTLAKRAASSSTDTVVVQGITRVGFRAGIEPTNIFLTGLAFFVAFICMVAIGVAAFKGFCELATRNGWMKGEKFQDFRNGWKIVLKGILFRIVLIGFPQMSILCLWELTVRDSAAEVVLALFYFVAMSATLVWAAFKVVRIAKRSVSMHKNPAYILYSDPTALNKWGFLYVQYRATAYYFIMPQLGYILVKAIFIAFAQGAPVAQAVGLLILEALWLIAVCILRPWMDKKTNTFNISIAVINFLNAIFLLIFTNVFNTPGMVAGIMGVFLFAYNAIFALVLLIMVLVSSVYAMVSKNPDTRYQPMRDDRGSFIKSQSNLNTELDALGATARGDMKAKLDDDTDSISSAQMSRNQYNEANHVPLPHSVNASTQNVNHYGNPPRSPIGASTPFIPQSGAPRHGTPGGYSDQGYNRSQQNGSPAPRYNQGGYNEGGYGQGGYGGGNYNYDRSGSMQSNTSYNRAQYSQGGSQWQRGAGYDH